MAAGGEGGSSVMREAERRRAMRKRFQESASFVVADEVMNGCNKYGRGEGGSYNGVAGSAKQHCGRTPDY